MKTSSASFVIVLSLVAMFLMGRVLAQSSAHPLDDVMSAQSQYPQRIRSIQVRFDAENVVVPQSKVQKWETIFAAKGVKYLERQRWQGEIGPPPVLYDGKSSYLMSYETSINTGSQTKAAATKLKKRESPAPYVLSFGYKWNEEWIGDLLRQDSFHLTGTENDPHFGTLYRVTGVAQKGQLYPYNLTFWFAPQYGFLAVRAEVQPSNGQGMRLVYRATDLTQQNGLWFAKTGVREAYVMGTNQVGFRYTMSVSDIKLNSVPDAVFDPTLTAGGKLYDQDANVVYRIGPEGKKMVDRRFTDPNESRNRLVGWLFVASLTLLLLLGLGALVRWRRQRGAA